MTLSLMPVAANLKNATPKIDTTNFNLVPNIIDVSYNVKKITSPEFKKQQEKQQAKQQRKYNNFNKLIPVASNFSKPETVNNIDFSSELNHLPLNPDENFEGDFSKFLNEIIKLGTINSADRASILKSLQNNPEVKFISVLVKKLIKTEIAMSLVFKKGMAVLTGNPAWLVLQGEAVVMLSKALVVVTQKGLTGKFWKMLASMIPFVGPLTPLLSKSLNENPLLTKVMSGYLGVRDLRIKKYQIIKQYKEDAKKLEGDEVRLDYTKNKAISELKKIKISERHEINNGIKKVAQVKHGQEFIKTLTTPVTTPLKFTKNLLTGNKAV
jgi:hypothetical protein